MAKVRQFKRVYLLQSFVRGFYYYDGPENIDDLHQGDMLEMVREYTNMYDQYAIALHHNGKKIGYLPREKNEILAKLMDADIINMQAEITHLNKNAATWENVSVAVYVLKEIFKDFPESANYLTVLKTPHYRSLKYNQDLVANIYLSNGDEVIFDEVQINDELDDERVLFAKHEVDDREQLLADLKRHLSEGRLLVNREELPADLTSDDLVRALDENMIVLDKFFDKNGYVVVNTNRLPVLAQRIDNIVEIVDKLGQTFYEVQFE